jgi:hypothetical protein
MCVCVNEQVWRNCLYYSGEKDDATCMAREVAQEFDSLYADRILAPMMYHPRHLTSNTTPQVLSELFHPFLSRLPVCVHEGHLK